MSATVADGASGEDIRPVVATGNPGKWPLAIFGVFLLLGGAWIVSLMSDQRAAMEQSGLQHIPDPNARISSPPPLVVPRDFGGELASPRAEPTPVVSVRTVPQLYSPPFRPAQGAPPQPSATQPDLPERPIPLARSAPVVFAAPEPRGTESVDGLQAGAVTRIEASRFTNPSFTVPQGTVIPAVLETAMDSTRPGGVRALVQRDVHSFDGTRVLIHRGSRLYGEYDAQLQRGQNRALIRWTRLIRPDGVTMALDSPASDPLGRAGVKGKVDGKFFQRFGGALLQSVLDVGVGVATREATDGVIVALPGSTQNVSPQVSATDIAPTLKVKHGTSVSVFVANDLDFSSVDS